MGPLSDRTGPRPGFTYAQHFAEWQEKAARPVKGLAKDERKDIYIARYNLERAARVRDAYAPSPELREALTSIDEPQQWMVLTEDWCADSAFSLAVIERVARLSDRVTLRILRRDEHPDVMDRYLTNGSRSIPKLVAYDGDGTELYTWGPRPRALQAIRDRMKDDGATREEMSRAVIEWYDAGGWRQVEAELAALVTLPVDA